MVSIVDAFLHELATPLSKTVCAGLPAVLGYAITIQRTREMNPAQGEKSFWMKPDAPESGIVLSGKSKIFSFCPSN